jgi:hypothetical protein
MRKQNQKRKQKPADSLLKTSKKKDIELTEKELGKASGGNVTLIFRQPDLIAKTQQAPAVSTGSSA